MYGILHLQSNMLLSGVLFMFEYIFRQFRVPKISFRECKNFKVAVPWSYQPNSIASSKRLACK